MVINSLLLIFANSCWRSDVIFQLYLQNGNLPYWGLASSARLSRKECMKRDRNPGTKRKQFLHRDIISEWKVDRWLHPPVRSGTAMLEKKGGSRPQRAKAYKEHSRDLALPSWWRWPRVPFCKCTGLHWRSCNWTTQCNAIRQHDRGHMALPCIHGKGNL